VLKHIIPRAKEAGERARVAREANAMKLAEDRKAQIKKKDN
jgi:hypothetical protein